MIFLFHAVKDKLDESVFYDIVCEGSAKTMVWQPADLGAYLHIVNGERYLGFTPTANYNAKAAYGIKGLVKVPELAPETNDSDAVVRASQAICKPRRHLPRKDA